MSKTSISCSVINCPNSSKASVFHIVPNDPFIIDQWATALKGRIGPQPVTQALVCPCHFRHDDLKKDGVSLKRDAVPLIFNKTLVKNDKPSAPKKPRLDHNDESELLQLKELLKTLKEEQSAIENADVESSKELSILQKKLLACEADSMTQNVLSKCFSPAQISSLKGNQRNKWSADDISVAYTLGAFTTFEFNEYFKKEFKFPLPATANIFRSCKKLD